MPQRQEAAARMRLDSAERQLKVSRSLVLRQAVERRQRQHLALHRRQPQQRTLQPPTANLACEMRRGLGLDFRLMPKQWVAVLRAELAMPDHVGSAQRVERPTFCDQHQPRHHSTACGIVARCIFPNLHEAAGDHLVGHFLTSDYEHCRNEDRPTECGVELVQAALIATLDQRDPTLRIGLQRGLGKRRSLWCRRRPMLI